jgi:single-strand DNA-binding protein
MGASVNKVILVGSLGKDPELRHTGNQTAVASMTLATNEYFEKDGKKEEKVEWHNLVAWGKQAETCAKYLAKGRQIYVEGKLQTRKWQDKEGKDRWSTEIVVQNVQFLGPNPNQQQDNRTPQQQSYGQPSYPSTPPDSDSVPF